MNMPGNTEIRAAATASDPRWAAVLARDPTADGAFVYSVRTTGVYCRPSCGARTARPENVAFHLDRRRRRARGIPPLQALQAGSALARRAAVPRWSPSCAGCIESAETGAEPRASWRSAPD